MRRHRCVGSNNCTNIYLTAFKNKQYCRKKCYQKARNYNIYWFEGGRKKDLQRLKEKYQEPEYNKYRKYYEKHLRPNKKERFKKALIYEKKRYNSDTIFKLTYIMRRRINIFCFCKKMYNAKNKWSNAYIWQDFIYLLIIT